MPGEVDRDTGHGLVDTIAATLARSVALTVDTDPAAIVAFARDVRPDILHLCGDTDAVDPAVVAQIRQELAGTGIELMQAVGVTDPEAVEVACTFAPCVDWILLDSVTDAVEGIGASGHVHDWSHSWRIVDAVDVPVVLAGGLDARNVAAAIATVGPAGVDSLSRTNRPLPTGGFVKSLPAVRAFVAAARSASTTPTAQS